MSARSNAIFRTILTPTPAPERSTYYFLNLLSRRSRAAGRDPALVSRQTTVYAHSSSLRTTGNASGRTNSISSLGASLAILLFCNPTSAQPVGISRVLTNLADANFLA